MILVIKHLFTIASLTLSMILLSASVTTAQLELHSSNSFISYSNRSAEASAQSLNLLSSQLMQINRFSNNLGLSSESGDENIVAEILGKVLVYPNPFRFSEGAEIGYDLSKDMDIEIRFYDMKGLEILKKYYSAGQPGGSGDYNRVAIDHSSFPRELPSGLYYFIVLNNGELMGKGKFVVKA